MGKTADTIRSSLWIWEKSCGELAIKPLWRMEGVVDQAMRKWVFSLKDATVGFGQKNLYCLISMVTVGQINCFSISKSPLLKRRKHFSVSKRRYKGVSLKSVRCSDTAITWNHMKYPRWGKKNSWNGLNLKQPLSSTDVSCGDVASAFVLEGLVLPPNTCFHTNIRAKSALALRSVANLLIAKECVIFSKNLRDASSVVYCACVT